MATALTAKQRSETIAALDKPLRAVYDTIVDETKNLQGTSIWGRWRIGKQIAEVTNNERKYGENAVEKLAVALGGSTSSSQLWEYRAFANAFSETQLKKALGSRMAGGGVLTYSHLRFLCNLKPEDRKTLLIATLKEGLSSSELAARAKEKATRAPGSGGRRPQAPKSINSGLSQIQKFSGDIHKRVSIWNSAIFDKITKGPADKVDANTIKQLQKTSKEVSQMVADGQALLESIEKSEERVLRVLEKKKASGASNGAAKASTKKKKKKTTKKKASSSASAKIAAAKKKKSAKKKAARPQPA